MQLFCFRVFKKNKLIFPYRYVSLFTATLSVIAQT